MTHNISLPDLCDFPDAGCSIFPETLSFKTHKEHLNHSIDILDATKFKKVHIDLIKRIINTIKLDQEEIKILQEQIARIHQTIDVYFNYIINKINRDDLPETKIYNNLKDEGCSPLELSDIDIKKLNKILGKEIDYLQNINDHDAKPHFYDRFLQFKINDKPELFNELNNIFDKNQVFESASKYLGVNRMLRLDSIALHIATPTDNHHYQTLKDLPTTSKLISLHMDPKFNLVKSILYLNEVDKDTGPFTTIPGSNKWIYDKLERLVACGNSTGNYLHTPKHRKVMRMMPKELRKNVILGRYVLDGTKLSDFLLNQMHEYTSDECNCIIFDPAQTLHRGGLSNTKNRINLQILMR